MPRAQSTLRLTRLCTSRHRSDRGARMKSRCVVIGFFVASSLVGCGGTVEGSDGGRLPPSPAGGSSRAGASGASAGAFGGTTGSSRAGSAGGVNLETSPASGGATSNVGLTSPQAGAPPMRDPNLPGVDFDDGSWIQLGSSIPPGSGGSAGPAPSPNAESAGGSASGDPGSPIPK